MADLYVNLIEDIKKQDIELLAGKYGENKQIDFKQDNPFKCLNKSDHELKKRFMVDVMAFANAAGGCLVYGIKEEEKKPTAFTPIRIESVDTFEGIIGSVINGWLQPQLHDYQIESIPVGRSEYIVVLYVPMSRNAPHGVWIPGSGQVYFAERTDEGSNRPYNFQTLRNKIFMMHTVNQQMKEFCVDRTSRIANNGAPVSLVNRPRLAMHILPLHAFYGGALYQVGAKFFDANDLWAASERYWRGSRKRQNFDGLLIHSLARQLGHEGYVQLFRNGCLEVVETGVFDNGYTREGQLIVSGNSIEQFLIFSYYKCTNVLMQLGVVGPLYCSLSLLGVKDYIIGGGLVWNPMQTSMPIDRDNLNIPEFEIVDVPQDVSSAAIILKDSIDLIWNASGWDASPNYDENGCYKDNARLAVA